MNFFKTAIVASCVQVWAAFPAASAENVIRNGDFNEGGAGWEVGYREPEIGTVTFETDKAPAGDGFARLAPTNSVTPRFLVLQQKINEPPAAGKYVLKVWMRVNDEYAGKRPVMQVGWRRSADDSYESIMVSLDKSAATGEWMLCESEVEIPDAIGSVYVFLFAYGSMGVADFDGASLESLP